MEKPKHPLHLKYPNLQKSIEVSRAVEKKERLDDGSVPNDPRERIEAYISRLEKIVLNKDERKRERNTEMLREGIYGAFIIKRENVPESYFELQQRVARERGQSVDAISPEMRERMIDTVIEDQKASLDRWIHYLQSGDAMYPPWFKYLVFRAVIHLSQFDKELGKFKTRNEHTVAPFPDIYHEALAKICDLYESAEKNKSALNDPAHRAFFEKKFPALYAHFIQETFAAQMERGEETKGEWVKYAHGSMEDAERLFESLQGKGTGWCTAGRSTAEMQVGSGDFYVYYTYDKDGKPTQPRMAIRMEENQIAEVRGVLEHQQLEPQMQEVVDEKLKEFGSEAEAFKKKSADMKRLTEIERKVRDNNSIDKDDLRFLYELNGPIEGFGYVKDPRIAEILSKREWKLDMYTIFGFGTGIDDARLAELSIEDGNASLVSLHIDELNGLTEKTALELIKAGEASVVFSNPSRFQSLNWEKIALEAIEARQGFDVVSRLNEFQDLDRLKIAERLIRTDQGHVIGHYLGEFPALSHKKLAADLIETGQGSVVGNHLKEFEVDPDEIATRLIEANLGTWVVNHLSYFRNHEIIAKKLIDTGQMRTLANSIFKFEGLSNHIIAELAKHANSLNLSVAARFTIEELYGKQTSD